MSQPRHHPGEQGQPTLETEVSRNHGPEPPLLGMTHNFGSIELHDTSQRDQSSLEHKSAQINDLSTQLNSRGMLTQSENLDLTAVPLESNHGENSRAPLLGTSGIRLVYDPETQQLYREQGDGSLALTDMQFATSTGPTEQAPIHTQHLTATAQAQCKSL